jgi:aspartokinase/homoserine dehydrogenase 1
MIVLKFGGSSVANAERIKHVASIVSSKPEQKLVVVSALGGVTDSLKALVDSSLDAIPTEDIKLLKKRHLLLAEELNCLNPELNGYIDSIFQEIDKICLGINALGECTERIEALIMGCGEKLSSRIIHSYFQSIDLGFNYANSEELIVANGTFLVAALDEPLTYKNIKDTIKSGVNYIAPGFIASNHEKKPVTLGRGGSDYSAAIYAGALKADRLEIWSDVDGMLNANPKIVKQAKMIRSLSYEEAFELSYFGAKVLYPPTIRPLISSNIPLELKNTFAPEKAGTVIDPNLSLDEDPVKGVTALSNVGLLNVSGIGMANQSGYAKRVFESLEKDGINVILITQCCSEHSICVGIDQYLLSSAVNGLNKEFAYEINNGLLNSVEVDEDYSIIALIGDRMINRIGLSGKVFSVLGENGINIKAIAQGASERNISVVINKANEHKAINVLHEAFFTENTKKIHLYVAGKGNVGSEFLNMLNKQADFLRNQYNLELRLVSIFNSKKHLQGESLDLNDLDNQFDQEAIGYENLDEIIAKIEAENLRNSIFIDNTASQVVSDQYEAILKAGASIATCNKIACSSDFERYSNLKKLAKNKVLQFKYETCVGAALPVIKTIQDLVQSGDRIKSVEAVLSGSLNFIFNTYNGTQSFADVVMEAKKLGFTEPNPLIDLSGVDAIRKILILARESGLKLNFEDVSNEGFLPDACLNAKSTEDLFEALRANESHFKALYDASNAKGERLKVVAKFVGDKASFGLKSVDISHPFYNLDGKDNIFSIKTDRYPEQPLIIKGAGAGAEVTASGVFSDLMLIVNK